MPQRCPTSSPVLGPRLERLLQEVVNWQTVSENAVLAYAVNRRLAGKAPCQGNWAMTTSTSNSSFVRIILNESFRNSVTAVDRLSDRLMAVKVDTREVELRVVSAYAPQVGCSEEEKVCFWEDLEQYVQPLEGEEVLLIGGDVNGHVGSRKDGFESCHGGYGCGALNDDGLRILEYALASDLIIANTQNRERKSHLITYTNGGPETQIDFWMLHRRDRRLLRDSKVIPTDHVAAQHHLLVIHLKIFRPRKRHPRTETQRIKWWNLKDRKRNKDVQAAIREKRSKCKLWWRIRHPEDRDAHLAEKREARKAVFMAKTDRYKAVYDMLDTREGERAVYRIVRARHRLTLDMEHTEIVQGILMKPFCAALGPVLPNTALEVSAALPKMKTNKATSPEIEGSEEGDDAETLARITINNNLGSA
ncbi:hypothetical protein RB195_012062 [Necator americanus]|uniref:Endonuclease/exonuclease/phosphatase domain-containing protein n=1 Tax=Necator americanus TaxID=51031 RepID=A0ABR1D5C6_NECAM